MPTFNIFVSVPKDKIPDGFLLETSSFLSAQLGKPEKVVIYGLRRRAIDLLRMGQYKSEFTYSCLMQELYPYHRAGWMHNGDKFITVRVVPDQMMCHGGSLEPCGSLQVYSIGALGEKNEGHSVAIGEFIESKLGIPKDRFYITFMDVARGDCGINGKTFAAPKC